VRCDESQGVAAEEPSDGGGGGDGLDGKGRREQPILRPELAAARLAEEERRVDRRGQGDDTARDAEPRGPQDPAEVEAFLDGLMTALNRQYRVAGSVVAVVADGEVLFQKGYGHEDAEARTPVDPETTLFRIASISKLFVWTSVMQAMERGLLDLDTDINGRHVLLIEDIVDTGWSLAYIKDNLELRDPASLRICALLDKRDRREREVDVDYVGFEIPNVFVVGYGMDLDEQYRELPFVGVLSADEETP